MSTDNPSSRQFEAAFQRVKAGSEPKYVSLIQDGRISTSEPGRGPITYTHEAELVEAISNLIDKGFVFGDEPAGWPPAAVLESLQERWLLERDFTAITWLEPGVFRTYVVPHMTETATCPQCSATAKYATLGHLFSLKCEVCGHEEEGIGEHLLTNDRVILKAPVRLQGISAARYGTLEWEWLHQWSFEPAPV